MLKEICYYILRVTKIFWNINFIYGSIYIIYYEVCFIQQPWMNELITATCSHSLQGMLRYKLSLWEQVLLFHKALDSQAYQTLFISGKLWSDLFYMETKQLISHIVKKLQVPTSLRNKWPHLINPTQNAQSIGSHILFYKSLFPFPHYYPSPLIWTTRKSINHLSCFALYSKRSLY